MRKRADMWTLSAEISLDCRNFHLVAVNLLYKIKNNVGIWVIFVILVTLFLKCTNHIKIEKIVPFQFVEICNFPKRDCGRFRTFLISARDQNQFVFSSCAGLSGISAAEAELGLSLATAVHFLLHRRFLVDNSKIFWKLYISYKIQNIQDILPNINITAIFWLIEGLPKYHRKLVPIMMYTGSEKCQTSFPDTGKAHIPFLLI